MSRNRWNTPVWDRRCNFCNALLLRGEDYDWCCHRGLWRIPPLPPLPPNVAVLLADLNESKDISTLSRRLNNLFCFTAIGASGGFTHFETGRSTVSITGRMYHRLYDINDTSHSIRWFIYDAAERFNHGLRFDVPSRWINAVAADLNHINPYVHHLQRFRDVTDSGPSALELSDFSADGDFAAIMHASNTTTVKPRGILIWKNSDQRPQFVPLFSRHYEPLQYPLLFPHGTPGWGLSDSQNGDLVPVQNVPFTQRVWYRCRLITEDRFLTFGRLTCEYICDMYSRVEEQRLGFIRRGLTSAQIPSYEDGAEGDDPSNLELPTSFLGSRKWAAEQTADSLALARTYGRPSFFITITCNPKAPEIQSRLRPGQDACDVPLIVARSFKVRHERLLKLLRTKFGTLVYIVKVIEFQKRGWPHAHIVCKVCTFFS